MATPTSFPRLRKDSLVSRTQDGIGRVLEPVARALQATPIMGAAAPAWLSPSRLLVDFVALPTRTPGYHKDALLYVHGRGGVSTAAGQLAGQPIYILPAGVRPGQEVRVPVRSSAGAYASIVIQIDGTIFAEQNVAAGGSVELTFNFLAEL